MPPTNAELTTQADQLSAENAKLRAANADLERKLTAAGEVASDLSAADVENLKIELERVRAERDEAKEHASGASQNATAVQETVHQGSVLNPRGTSAVPREMDLAPNVADLQTDSEPCTEHYPKGWPAEEEGAGVSCEHGRWIYGQTPKTSPKS